MGRGQEKPLEVLLSSEASLMSSYLVLLAQPVEQHAVLPLEECTALLIKQRLKPVS